MEVILLERVEKLGAIGDVVTVKNGFARNYLLPNKKALRANEANRKLFEVNRSKIEADNADKRAEAEKASKGVEGKTVQLIRQASNVGHLYGSVSARDIVDALAGEGAHVTKSQVVLDRPIKAIGMHDVKVALHPEVAVTVKVNVARSPEEADLQAQGIDVMQQMFERDAAPLAEEFSAEAEPAADEADAGEATAESDADAGTETVDADADAEAPAAAEPAEAPAAEEGEPQA
jgi:large subunit ribosomal protein L9